MPRLYEPDDPNRPKEVEVAVQILGNRVRNEILRYLKLHPESYLGDIVEGVGISRNTVAPQLVPLEDAGVIVGRPARGQRRGRSVMYSINEPALEAMIDSWVGYVLGESALPTWPTQTLDK